MKLAHSALLTAILLVSFSVTHAETITSNSLGGFWSEGSTWEGGSVPTVDDRVVITGPVQVDGVVLCLSILVEPAGTLTAALQGPPLKAQVTEYVHNQGTIANGSVWLDLDIGGDLSNTGSWNNHVTTLTGTGDRQISDGSAAGFDCEFQVSPGASGEVHVATPTTLHGFVDLGDLTVILQPGAHLTLNGSVFKGQVLAGGNQLRFQAWSYLNQCTIDDAVLVGEARVASATFTTQVIVKDSLRNTTATGGGSAIVQGDLINHGLIQNDNYSFFFQVHGDVKNHGTLDMPNLEMMGVGVEHRLYTAPGASLLANVFLPEFQPSTLIVESPVTFGGGLGLGVGELILEPGASIHFSQHSGLGSGTVMANGNTITTETGNSSLSGVTIDNGVFGSFVAIAHEVYCFAGLTIEGTLTGWPWAAADLTVAGLLRNEGTITDGDHPVRLEVLNDMQNLGVMDNARLVVSGTVNQTLGIGPGIDVPECVLESGLVTGPFQWFKNGSPMTGQTDADLVFNTLGSAEYGRYHCQANDQVSRSVLVAENLVTTDVPDVAAVTLEQNYPNPFNPATRFAFSLENEGPVSLVVYDLAGRQVDRLVDRPLASGRHVVTWAPQGLSSGTYFYCLRAEGVGVVRKCSLLK